tara:strand:- start:2386 stop:3861 length:1476 start_codon:yes stop_codon:yes gene_type:complete
MAYIINKTNGTQIAVVEDGTIDQTTDLKLVGKNYAGYGEIQNENFVHLLENFASANQPAKAIAGQMWFDSGASKLKFYDGTKFRTTGGAEVSTTQPSGLTTGDFWWDSGNSQLYANTGSGFILIGPQSQGSTVTQMLTATVRDNAQVNRTVMKGIIADETVFIVSAVEFTIDSTDSNNAITGFDVVRAGLTLKNTTNATGGVTSTAHRYYGTSSNTDKLGGFAASDYVRGSVANFSTIVRFADAGFTVGDSNDLAIKIENDNQGVIQNDIGQIIKFKVDNASAQVKEPLNITADGILPSASATFNVGSSALKWNIMYANEFNGKATVASAMEVPVGSGTANRTASTAASNDTVAVRDGSGDIYATNFQGTALKANYADLAEKYVTDTQYPVGTIMTVGGEGEMTSCAMTEVPCGIISNKPGVVLNSDAEGQAIALVGRTPLRVMGPVEKGDKLYVGANGTAQKAPEGDMVGIALEANERFEEKLVEVFIKI